MGLMDKVKAQATQLAQKTQETARDGLAKFDQVQANRRADALLRDLGALIYAEHTGRGAPDSQAQIDRLIQEISAHEAQNGINLAGQPADQPGPGAGAPGFPGPAPAGYPSDPGAAGFPPQPGPSGFPPQSGPGGFATQPGPGGYPSQSDPAAFPPQPGQTGLPPQSGPGGLPPEAGPAGFPPETETDYPEGEQDDSPTDSRDDTLPPTPGPF
jgi:hypothetical protein